MSPVFGSKQRVKDKRIFLLIILLMSISKICNADSTFVFFRHGEKPKGNSGQLTCQGLNRSLSLPALLINRYGRPDRLYAAAPKEGSVRPLATILPLAIKISEPVIIRYSANQPRRLSLVLLREHKVPLTFISWERKNLVLTVAKFVSEAGGNASIVPYWPPNDFDSIFEVVLDENMKFKYFKHTYEGLNNLPLTCPVK